MKTCECGGLLYKHSIATAKTLPTGTRYRCKECKKFVTVRCGQLSTLRGRPMKADQWRDA